MSLTHSRSESLVETTAGLTAGFASTIVLHPLDVIKTRLQVKRQRLSLKFGDSFRVARDIAKNEGNVRGLYRGLTPNLVGNTLSWGVYFFCYKQLQDAAHRIHGTSPVYRLSGPDYFLAAGFAGALTALITNPIWVIKTRMLSTSGSAPGAYPSLYQGASTILRVEGLRGFYRGLVPSLLGTSHGAVQFLVYEKLKIWQTAYDRSHLSNSMSAGATAGRLTNVEYLYLSALAKLVAMGTTYPYQVVRARLQVYDADTLYKGGFDVVRQTWRQDGIGGFYRGLGPSVARVLPNVCLTFLVYENVRFYLPRMMGATDGIGAERKES